MASVVFAAVAAVCSAPVEAIPAPPFQPVHWLYGRPISEAEMGTRAVLIELWATW